MLAILESLDDLIMGQKWNPYQNRPELSWMLNVQDVLSCCKLLPHCSSGLLKFPGCLELPMSLRQSKWNGKESIRAICTNVCVWINSELLLLA